jgi:O-antigen biosynthesis protein WbqP
MNGFYERHAKRWLDFAFAAVAILCLSPLLILTALIIRLQDGGPAIFRQVRVGREQQPFTIFKFRSMPVATPHLASADARKVTITPFGRFIRRTNIDELPQLFNILRGEMSLIGPRPALASQAELLRMREAARVMRARPGLTGLAQVNSYDGMTEADKVEWERRYVERITLGVDASIVARTFVYLLRPPPVY